MQKLISGLVSIAAVNGSIVFGTYYNSRVNNPRTVIPRLDLTE